MHSPHGNGYLDGALRSPKQRGSMRDQNWRFEPGVRPVKGQAVSGAALLQGVPGPTIRGTTARGDSEGSRIDRGMNASVWCGAPPGFHGHSFMEQGHHFTRLAKGSASVPIHRQQATQVAPGKPADTPGSGTVAGRLVPDQRLIPSPHISPPFVARASSCRCDGGHGPEDGEGVADTTSSRLQGVRPFTASRSACVVEGR